jgi:amidase
MTTVSALESLGHEVVETRPIIDAAAMSRAFLAVWASFADTILQLILSEVDKRKIGHLIHRTLGDWATMKLLANRDARKSGIPAFEPFTWDLARRSRRMTPGGFALAQATLQDVAYEMARFLGDYDVLITPVLGAPPLPIGAIDQDRDHEELVDQLIEYVGFTPLANFTGLPAMSVPMHMSEDGLPVGTQVIGRFGDEETLLSLAGQLERTHPWSQRRPGL